MKGPGSIASVLTLALCDRRHSVCRLCAQLRVGDEPRLTKSATREGNRMAGSMPKSRYKLSERAQMSRSMSPIRGDVKKEFSSFLSERRQMVACIQPNLSSGEAGGSPRIPDRPGSLAVRTGRFHDAMVIRRLRFWKLRKQTRWL
jgi:hypothetical protein